MGGGHPFSLWFPPWWPGSPHDYLQDAGAAGTAWLQGLLEIGVGWAEGDAHGPGASWPSSRSRHQQPTGPGASSMVGPPIAKCGDRGPCWESWSASWTQLPLQPWNWTRGHKRELRSRTAQRQLLLGGHTESQLCRFFPGTGHALLCIAMEQMTPNLGTSDHTHLLPHNCLGWESRQGSAGLLPWGVSKVHQGVSWGQIHGCPEGDN